MDQLRQSLFERGKLIRDRIEIVKQQFPNEYPLFWNVTATNQLRDEQLIDVSLSSTHIGKLGRKIAIDKRDNNYLIKDKLPNLFTTAITSRYWSNNEYWGDQGQTPQCVGYSWAHFIDGGPITHTGPRPNINPTVIYNGAQANDEWHGNSYDGTSVRGGAKWLKLENKISSYLWATDIRTITNTVLNIGPIVVGTNWTYNMFFPDRNGLIRATGRIVGGHAYVLDGVDTVKKLFRLKNSWGRSWGIQGVAYISFSDMSMLIRQRGGEACLAIEMNF